MNPKMQKLTRDVLRELSEAPRQPSVSIFLPTHRAGKEVRQDPIRFKNLVRRAEEQLTQLDEGLDTSELLEFAYSIPETETDDFWQHSSDGMALFMQSGFSRGFRLPIEFDELAMVAQRFHVKPLFSYLQGDGHFFVLAVSPKRVRLFEGGKHSLNEVDTDLLPETLVEALNIDEYQSTLQFHSHSMSGASASAEKQAIYHGHGGGSDADKKEELLKFFRKLDDGINEFFGVEPAPLVFAGVEYLFPIYQQANNYRNLVDSPVPGNQDDASADELHGPAWQVVEPRFAADRRQIVEKYGTLAARQQASDDLDTVIQAAREGRVDTLLLAEGVRRWGTVSGDGSVKYENQSTANNEDLLDYAGVQSFNSGANVLLFSQDQMPSDSPIAALFRY